MKALGQGSIASLVEVGLAVARIALWAMLGLWVIAFLAYLGFIVLMGAGALDPTIADAGNSDNFRIRVFGVDSGTVENVRWTDWHIIVPSLLLAGVGVGGSLIIVSQLRLLFDSFRSGEPFRRTNAHHLRVIWMTMLGIELARYVLLAAFAVLLGVFGGPEIDADITRSFNISTWGSILILIVLAEVFREGARLKEEQELTI